MWSPWCKDGCQCSKSLLLTSQDSVMPKKYEVLNRDSQGTACVQSSLSSDVLDLHPLQSFEIMYWPLWVYTVYFWIISPHPPTYFLSNHMKPSGEYISYGSPCRLSSFPCSVHLSPGLSNCAQWLRDFSSKPEAIRFTWFMDVKLQMMARVTGGKVPAECVLKSRGRRRSRHVLGPVMKTM